MRLDKVAVMGGGVNATTLYRAIEDKNIVVLNDGDGNDIPIVSEHANYSYINPYPLYEPNKDNFICKGKHKYRDIGNSIWQCECGRKTTD